MKNVNALLLLVVVAVIGFILFRRSQMAAATVMLPGGVAGAPGGIQGKGTGAGELDIVNTAVAGGFAALTAFVGQLDLSQTPEARENTAINPEAAKEP